MSHLCRRKQPKLLLNATRHVSRARNIPKVLLQPGPPSDITEKAYSALETRSWISRPGKNGSEL